MKTTDTNNHFLEENRKQLSKNPFTTPDGYFDTLPQQVRKKIPKKKTNAEKAGIWYVLRPYIAFASVLFVILFAWKIALYNTTSNKETSNPASPAKDDSTGIIDYVIAEIDEQSMVEYIGEEQNTTPDSVVQQQKREATIEYLLDNDFDYDLVINDL